MATVRFAGQANYIHAVSEGVSRELVVRARELAGQCGTSTDDIRLQTLESPLSLEADVVIFTRTSQAQQALDKARTELDRELSLGSSGLPVLTISGMETAKDALRNYPVAMTVFEWLKRGLDMDQAKDMLESRNLWFSDKWSAALNAVKD